MPLYYFHTHADPAGFNVDGHDLANEAAARNEAVQLLVDLLNRQPQAFWCEPSCWVTVCDSNGEELFTIEMRQTEAPAVRRRA